MSSILSGVKSQEASLAAESEYDSNSQFLRPRRANIDTHFAHLATLLTAHPGWVVAVTGANGPSAVDAAIVFTEKYSSNERNDSDDEPRPFIPMSITKSNITPDEIKTFRR